jgi:prepilin-type N-terminal cleavage/methylation domain-containing protein
MANRIEQSVAGEGSRGYWRRRSGFTLLEMLIVLGVLSIIAAATFSLVTQNVPIFVKQQNQSALNLSLRNAIAQIQIDTVNAGEGFYQSSDVAAWPTGLTIVNNVAGTSCYDSVSKTYGPSCFDSLNIIATDRGTPSTPAAIGRPSTSDGINPIVTSGGDFDLYVTPVPGTTASQLIGRFAKGDHLLLLTTSQEQMTTVTITGNPAVSGSMIHFLCGSTGAGGVNTSTTNDPYGLTTGSVDTTKLTDKFDPSGWVLKLAPITYQVDANDPTNPKLTRTDSSDCPTTNPCVIAEQIIGFKVGASVWNKVQADDTTYNYDRTKTPYAWTDVRAVRLTLIGRTDPNSSKNTFHNTFDDGNYRVEALSVVVNPRNLSMNDR